MLKQSPRFIIFSDTFLNYFKEASALGATGEGTTLFMGLVDFRKLKIALRSSSDAFAKLGHGIGGRSGRELSIPFNFPSRNDFINCFSDHEPIPVSSEVKLAA